MVFAASPAVASWIRWKRFPELWWRAGPAAGCARLALFGSEPSPTAAPAHRLAHSSTSGLPAHSFPPPVQQRSSSSPRRKHNRSLCASSAAAVAQIALHRNAAGSTAVILLLLLAYAEDTFQALASAYHQSPTTKHTQFDRYDTVITPSHYTPQRVRY